MAESEIQRGYMVCGDCGDALTNPLKDICATCEKKWNDEYANDEAYADAMAQEND